MIPEVGSMVYIQSFKHDGSLHRTWAKGYVLHSNEDEWIVVTHKTWVSESDGRSWYTREPAICFFYPNKWYNVISMIRKTGIYYYCNLASPCVYDVEAIKNIDYDLDVKVYPDKTLDILDEDEFELHQRQMDYPQDVIQIVRDALEDLLDCIDHDCGPFDNKLIKSYFETYLKQYKQK